MGTWPEVKAAFEKTCDCTVKFVPVADGVALLTRLKLEGASSPADIALGLDTSLVKEAKDTGLFSPMALMLPAPRCPAISKMTFSSLMTTAILP